MRSALVTGGAGFIGSNLVDALLREGVSVSAIDNFATGRRANIDPALDRGARLVEGDIRDGDALARALDPVPDVVFHMAAQVDVRKSVEDPAFDADVNVGGTVGVLEAARAAGVGRFVFSSTGGAVYGEAVVIPTPEGHPPAPLSAYGAGKLCGEVYVDLFRRLHGVSAVVLRYANVYGPRQDPLGEGGVVAIFCHRMREREPATIFGDGSQTRDFVHVDDVVRANLLAARSDVTGAYNVGRGEETSVSELAQLLAAIDPDAGFAPERAEARIGEVQRSCIDPALAGEVLGWRPEIPVAEGLALTYRAGA